MLKDVVLIKESDYSTLVSSGSITKNGITHTYSNDNLYIIDNPTVNEATHATNADYATAAGTAHNYDGTVSISSASNGEVDQIIVRVGEKSSSPFTVPYASNSSYADEADQASNLNGGVAGCIPYQSGTDGTVFLSGSATNGYVLKYNTQSKAPYWAADNDTKNTAGSTNDASKLYLIGAKSQTASAQTYAHSLSYAQAGKLYSNGSETVNLADAQTMSGAKTFSGTLTAASTVYFKGLGEGTSNVTDDTEILTSYAGAGGFANTTGAGQVYRRGASKLYNYIKGKTDTLYPTKGGSGASGSWNINITGSAGYATSASSATSASKTSHLYGGASGSIPFQTAAGTTAFLAAGTNGQILALESGSPKWKDASSTHNHNGGAAKTAWGQTYVNASGALQTISGNMTSVGTITATGDNTITKENTDWAKFKATNNNGSVSLGSSTNRGVYDETKTQWIVATNTAGTNMWTAHSSSVKFGIGTDSPTEKLHVIGNIKSSGSVLAGTYVEAGTYARIKGGDIYAGTASGAQCHLQYDTTDECMKFIFD